MYMSHESFNKKENIEISEETIGLFVAGNEIQGKRVSGEGVCFELVKGVELLDEAGNVDQVLTVNFVDDIPNVEILDKEGDVYSCFGSSQHIKVDGVEIYLDPQEEKESKISGPSIEKIREILSVVQFGFTDLGDI